MGRYQDWQWATETLATARDKSAGKPVQNNTRLFQRSDDSIAVKLHAVDVVTINADGTWTLRAGGWHTVTTMERIRGYSPAQLFSERGDWYLRLEPDAADPAPMRVDREVPKPYTATDPGLKPVKNDEGCQAGTMIGTDHKDEEVRLTFRSDMREGDELVEVRHKSGAGEQYDSVTVKRSWTSWTYYGEFAQSWQDDDWKTADKTDTTYAQCPHCAAFDTVHERWRYGMHGDRWGRRFDQQTGWQTYSEMMYRFGSMEAWQDAYLADYRARMAYLKADKAWDERNRIPFYDGVIVDSDGYAKRERKNGPSKAKLRKHEGDVKRMKMKIDKYVLGFIRELKKGMPMPSGGDCWYCSMQTAEGVPLGDSTPTLYRDGTVKNQVNTDHLLDHMSEKYYVPSLAVNAMRESGYRDAGIYMYLDMDPVRVGDDKMVGTGKMGKSNGRYDDVVKRALVKYLRKRLVPAAPTQ